MENLEHPTHLPNEQESPFLPLALKYGLIGGLLFIVYSLAIIVLEVDLFSLGGMALNFLVWIGIFAGIAIVAVGNHRKEHLGGYISFRRAFSVSFVVALISSLINQFFSVIYNMLDPGYIASMKDNMVDYLESMGAPEESIEQAIQALDNPVSFSNILQGILTLIIVGAIVSLIVAAIMKRKAEA